MPPPPSRRSLLRGLVVGGALAVLAGCEQADGDRLPSPTGAVEPDDPRTWPDDTQLLIAARQRIHGHRQALSRVVDPPGVAADLDRLWATQVDRLEQLVTLGGVPLPALPLPTTAGSDTASATTAGGDTASATTAGGDTASATTAALAPADVGRSLRGQLPAVVEEVATSTPTNLAMLTSLAAQQAHAAGLLGAPVDWAPLAGPRGAAAVPLLAVTRPAVFGLEVVAARSGADERDAYEAILEEVRSLTRQLTTLAGDAAPVPPLGYDLPEPLETAQQRRALARALVADIAAAGLHTAQRLRGDAGVLVGAVRVVAEATAWRRRLGGDPEPFPGMTLPSA